MTTKKTDWKKERSKVLGKDWQDPGKEILAKGTRQSTNNDVGGKADSMEELMRMWQENHEGRRKNKKRMPFKGLFGGGE